MDFVDPRTLPDRFYILELLMTADPLPSTLAQVSAALPQPLKFGTVDAAQAHLSLQGVGHVLAQFVDIHG
ncbi:MAG: hypothetical protein EBR45_13285, partial [Betaproteobacteria bacterium]|nr:hypothetical protein [Betaproteobacteria bacterium]